MIPWDRDARGMVNRAASLGADRESVGYRAEELAVRRFPVNVQTEDILQAIGDLYGVAKLERFKVRLTAGGAA